MSYTIILDAGIVVRDSDGHTVSPCQSAEDPDFLAYQAWVKAGGEPKTIPTDPNRIDIEARKTEIINAVQAHLDTTAQGLGYDGILSMCSYAASTNPKFGAEGRAGVTWRDEVWSICYTVMAQVQAGQRAIPTADEMVVLLPPFLVE